MGRSKRSKNKYTKEERRRYALSSQPEETVYMEEEGEQKAFNFFMEGIEPWKPAVPEIPFPDNEIHMADSIDIKNINAY